MIHTFGEVIYAKRTVNLVAPVMPLIVEYFTRIKATVEEMSNAKKKKKRINLTVIFHYRELTPLFWRLKCSIVYCIRRHI